MVLSALFLAGCEKEDKDAISMDEVNNGVIMKTGNNGIEYEVVDLGFGTLWAKCNVGAETETDYGLYFQWGDTQGYTADQVGTDNDFTWNDYKYGTYDVTDNVNYGMTKYNGTDGKTVLDLEDDAARANMGGEWRMATKERM